MKIVLFALAAVALAGLAKAADAPKTTCIDPDRSYLARTLNNHEVYVETTIGRKKPPVRLTTSCQHLEAATSFGLAAEFHCVGQGDSVVANLFGERQTCRITKVAPYTPRPDDLPAK